MYKCINTLLIPNSTMSNPTENKQNRERKHRSVNKSNALKQNSIDLFQSHDSSYVMTDNGFQSKLVYRVVFALADIIWVKLPPPPPSNPGLEVEDTKHETNT